MNIEQFKSTLKKRKGLARSNQFVVNLPPLGFDTSDINMLCSNVNMPGRQILTQERLIGIKGRKMPIGFASDDVSMTFYLTNDYMIKNYFQAWQQSTISQDTYEISYPRDYVHDVKISQLKKGIGFDLPIDSFFGIDIDIDIRSRETVVYECTLLDAYVTTLNAIELSNDLDGLLQLNVQLSYRNWTDDPNSRRAVLDNSSAPQTSIRPRARPANATVAQ